MNQYFSPIPWHVNVPFCMFHLPSFNLHKSALITTAETIPLIPRRFVRVRESGRDFESKTMDICICTTDVRIVG